MLPNRALLETKQNSTPTELATLMRNHGKLFWWERGGFYLVTDYELAETVLKGPDFTADRSGFFISRMPNMNLSLIGDFFGVIKKMMVMSDAPEHTARRRFAALGVADQLMDNFRPSVEKTIAGLVGKAAAKGSFDFVADIAMPLPSIVLANLFCIDETERRNFYAWSNNMTQFFGGASQYRNEDGIEVNKSASSIRDYFVELIAKRRHSPADDFLSVLLRSQVSFGLDDNEVISQAVMMLVAGQITTTDQICNNMYSLLTEPGALEQLQKNPSLVDNAMEEFNRLDPAVTFLFRVAKKETQLGPTTIPNEGVVFVSNHAVNRDPRVFEMPDECRFDRPKNPHMAYGHGPHFCLGAKLARIQMSILFTELVTRYPALRLDEDKPAVRKHESLAFSGFETLGLRV